MEGTHPDTLDTASSSRPGKSQQSRLAVPAVDAHDGDDGHVDVYADAPEPSYDTTSSGTSDEQSLHSAAESQDEDPDAGAEERAAAQAEAERLAREKEEAEFLRQQQEEVICRICFEGPGSTNDDGSDMGRLLKPCKCKGTMRYIHSGCLDEWRRHSRNANSAVACDQCGAPYRFRSSRFVGLANSRALNFLVSALIFLLLVWFAGTFTLWFSDRFDGWGSRYLVKADWSRLMYLDLDDGTYYMYRRAVSRHAAPLVDDDDDDFSWDELGFFGRTMFRMALGSGAVGLISATATLGLTINPIGMGRLARDGLRDRWLGGGTRAVRGGRGKSDGLAVTALIVIAAIVLAGMAKALYSTYRLVRRMSRHMLAYAEDSIVDWYGDDEQPHEEQNEPEATPVPPPAEGQPDERPADDEAEEPHAEDGMIDPEPDWLPERDLAVPAA